MLWFWAYSLIGLLTSIGYAYLVKYSLETWEQIPNTPCVLPEPAPNVSIIVPGRNEAGQLPESLSALLKQDYPASRYEILFIDDHSTDDSLTVARRFEDSRLRIIELKNHISPGTSLTAYKKKALQTGITLAQHDIILCTDADCKASPGWVRAMTSALEHNKWQAVTGPVLGRAERHSLQQFQSLDFAGMMLMTAAGLKSGQFTLGNGASLGFRRSAFEKVGGYEGNEGTASGDDVFLLRKIAERFPGQIGFLKTPQFIVRTDMKAGWRSFLQQRLRWGTKNRSAASGGGATIALGTVFLLSWMILCTPLLIPVVGLPAAVLSTVLISAKGVSDRLLLGTATTFFRRRELLRRFWMMESFHTLYIAVVGLLSLFTRRYSWKGRSVS